MTQRSIHTRSRVALLLALSALVPPCAAAFEWAYEGSLHPFDSKALRRHEVFWESNATIPVAHLSKDHILVVLITTSSRLSLILASRKWRQGLTTVIVTDQPTDETEYAEAFQDSEDHNEHWAYYRDTPHAWQKRGDLRAAMAPFLANLTIGVDNFRWMLFGDDDTVFHIHNIMRRLQRINPDVPTMLSDAYWFHSGQEFHHNRAAPRCLPCHYEDELLDDEVTCPHLGFQAPRGCPCRISLLCQWDNLEIFDRKTCAVRQEAQDFWWFAHGGAGVMMSNTLFKEGRFEDVEHFLNNVRQRNGDGMLHEAVTKVLHIAPTDPGPGYCRPYLQLFDPGWQTPAEAAPYGKLGIGEDPVGVIRKYQEGLKGQSTCARKCHEQLRSTLSVHIRSQTSASELRDLMGLDFYDLPQQPEEEGYDAAKVDPNLRAAAWMVNMLNEVWDAYEDKLLRGLVPTAPLPPERPAGTHMMPPVDFISADALDAGTDSKGLLLSEPAPEETKLPDIRTDTSIHPEQHTDQDDATKASHDYAYANVWGDEGPNQENQQATNPAHVANLQLPNTRAIPQDEAHNLRHNMVRAAEHAKGAAGNAERAAGHAVVEGAAAAAQKVSNAGTAAAGAAAHAATVAGGTLAHAGAVAAEKAARVASSASEAVRGTSESAEGEEEGVDDEGEADRDRHASGGEQRHKKGASTALEQGDEQDMLLPLPTEGSGLTGAGVDDGNDDEDETVGEQGAQGFADADVKEQRAAHPLEAARQRIENHHAREAGPGPTWSLLLAAIFILSTMVVLSVARQKGLFSKTKAFKRPVLASKFTV